MIIKGAEVFQEDGTFCRQEVRVKGGKIVGGGCEGVEEEVIDASGLYAVPGLIDIHFHGCMGKDFSDGTEEAVHTIAAYELSQGITSICPATMTLPAGQIAKICEVAGQYREKARVSGGGAREASLRGINLEGPFISPEKKGAQKADYILPPDAGLLREWMRLGRGLCRLVDIAPESKGAMEFIREVKDEIHISLAHTTADYDTAKRAFACGADHITHLYNAMPGFSHRAPGVIGAGAEEGAYGELICDGIHIHPSVIRATMKLYGSSRVVFISDSMEATGLGDGEYQLGGQAVSVRGNEARLADGTLAGSVTNLMDCVRFAVRHGEIPLGAAVKCASVNPAKSIGIYHEVGSLEEGKEADILLIDKELNLVKVIHGGVVVG